MKKHYPHFLSIPASVLVILPVIIYATATGCNTGILSPKQTVEAFLEAFYEGDLETARLYLLETETFRLKDDVAVEPGNVEIVNVELDEEGNKALIEVELNLDDELYEIFTFKLFYQLEKVKGHWFITGLESNHIEEIWQIGPGEEEE